MELWQPCPPFGGRKQGYSMLVASPGFPMVMPVTCGSLTFSAPCVVAVLFVAGAASSKATPPEGEVRSGILDYLRKHPGASVTEICAANRLGWGSVQYHLLQLQRSELVQAMLVGHSRAFFASPMEESRMKTIAILRKPAARKISSAIIDQPGIRQKELLVRVHLTRRVFRRHMNRLLSAGLVNEDLGTRERTYVPSPRLLTEGREVLESQNPEAPRSNLPAFFSS